MFTADDIQQRLRAQPFEPVRVVSSTGHTYDIYHPDLVLVGRRSLTIGIAGEDHPTQYERTTKVAIIHVVALEDLLAQGHSDGDGQASGQAGS